MPNQTPTLEEARTERDQLAEWFVEFHKSSQLAPQFERRMAYLNGVVETHEAYAKP